MPTAGLTLSRIIRAPREEVFAAWTQPHLLMQWWGPSATTCPEAHVDLREGGRYRIANLDSDGSIIWIEGRFERIRAPGELVYTWIIGKAREASLVTVRFRRHPEGTELILSHQRIGDEVVAENHAKGWNGCLDKLALLLEADR